VADLAHIDDKLAKRIAGLIRLLSSNRPGEVAAATQALGRTLQKAGADVVFTIADRVEHPNELSEADMQKLVDTGIEIGVKRAKQELRNNGQASHGAPQLPSARDMTMFCYQHLNQLDDWYQNFIPSILIKRIQRGIPLTASQQSKLEEAYFQLGGRI
jgi:hypothetical protein